MPQSPWIKAIENAKIRSPWNGTWNTYNINIKTSAVWPIKTVNWLITWASSISVVWTPYNNSKGLFIIFWRKWIEILEYKIPATKLRSRRPFLRSWTKVTDVSATAMVYKTLAIISDIQSRLHYQYNQII